MYPCKHMPVIEGMASQWHFQLYLVFSQRDFKTHNMESKRQKNPVFLSNVTTASKLIYMSIIGEKRKEVGLIKSASQQLRFFCLYVNTRDKEIL